VYVDRAAELQFVGHGVECAEWRVWGVYVFVGMLDGFPSLSHTPFVSFPGCIFMDYSDVDFI